MGSFALKDPCPRCLWIKLQTANKLPYQFFPGIFSSIDSYTKKYVSSYYQKFGKFPEWLLQQEECTGLVKKLHHSHFNILDEDIDILLSGVPDEILTLKDGYFILDYKTARYTETQDSLLPVYEVQLNAYAYIAERNNLSPVKKVALAYMEPQTDLTSENVEEIKIDEGFLMPFWGKIVPLDLNPAIIPEFLKKARKLYDQPTPPQTKEGCKDCFLLENLIKIIS